MTRVTERKLNVEEADRYANKEPSLKETYDVGIAVVLRCRFCVAN